MATNTIAAGSSGIADSCKSRDVHPNQPVNFNFPKCQLRKSIISFRVGGLKSGNSITMMN